jgi:DNA-binding NarL/FixJ family response regulator
MNRMAIAVYVVDDHALVRRGLASVINLEPGLQVVGEGSDSAATLTAIKRLQPEVLVVDLEMPTIRGPEFVMMAKQAVPSLRVVACTMHGAHGYVADALRSGADGYVLKSSPSDLLLAAIHAVAGGQGFIDPALQGDVVRLVQDRAGAGAELTADEIRVLRFAADGLTNRQIAVRLGQSVETVKLRLRWSFRKLGATDRASAVAAAIRRGLL